MSWNRVTVGELVSTKKGFAFKSDLYVESGVPIVRVSNFTLDSISDEDLKYYPERERVNYSDFVIREKDIIVQTVGSWQYNPASVVGKVVYVPYYLDGALLNQNAVKLIPNKRVDRDFLYYRLRCDDFKGHVIGEARGAANQASITLDTIKSFSFDIPEYDLQCKISAIIAAYDNLIENNQKQIKLLEEAAQRLYKEWFVDMHFPGYENTTITDGVPEGWRLDYLTNIAYVQYGYAFDSSLFNNKGKGKPIIRIRNIPDGNTEDYTTEEANEQYIIKNGDIVVGMDGEFYINSWCGEDAYIVQRTCCIKPKNKKMNGYVFWAIYEPIKYFEKTVVGATVAHLGKKHIDTIKILTAPDKFYVPFQILFERRQILLNQSRILAEARDRLLPKLMNGEIEV